MIGIARHSRAEPVASLRTIDRCDRCQARALWRVTRGISVLLLCGHHGEQHCERLRAEGWQIDRPLLEP